MLEDVVDRVFVGRQSIHDRQLGVVAYELRFTTSDRVPARPFASAEAMTRDVLFGALTIGLDRLVGDKRVFCSVDRDLLVGDVPLTLLPARTVIAVATELGSDDAVLAGVRRLIRQGFTVALEDFHRVDGVEPLLELASVVKINPAAVPGGELEQLMTRCRRYDVQLLAERVDSAPQLNGLRSAGFDLFQGFALQRPTFAAGRAVATGDLSRLQQATAVLGQVLDFDEIEEILRTEPGLTYQVLRLASLGRPGETRRAVSTVRDALVRAGSWRIQSWIALLLSRRGTPAPADGLVVALTRARACELLAVEQGASARSGFTAGMVSSFEQLLQIPARELCSSLPLSEELREAAFGTQTPLGRIVRDVADRQDGRLHAETLSELTGAEIDAALAGAVAWALEATEAMD